MTSRRAFLACIACVVLAQGLTVPAGAVNAAQPKVRLAVVVAKNSSLTELSFSELKRLYLGDTVSGPGGRKLIPLTQVPTSRDRVGFDRAVLGMSAESVARYWIDRKIRGQSGPPKAIDSIEVLQRLVSSVDGAIGYVRPDQVRGDVKVLRIDGLLPSDANYRVEY